MKRSNLSSKFTQSKSYKIGSLGLSYKTFLEKTLNLLNHYFKLDRNNKKNFICTLKN